MKSREANEIFDLRSQMKLNLSLLPPKADVIIIVAEYFPEENTLRSSPMGNSCSPIEDGFLPSQTDLVAEKASVRMPFLLAETVGFEPTSP